MEVFSILALVFTSYFQVQSKKDDPSSAPASPNFEDSLKKDLWAYFDFNNSNLSDLSGKNHHMVAVNGLKFGYDRWGNDNNALEFDGINDYAVIDSGRVFPEGNFTVSMLVMVKSAYGRIFQKGNITDAKGASFGLGFDDTNNNGYLVFNISKDNNICTVTTDGTNSSPLNVAKVIRPYAWYNVVIQHINGVEKVYYNGMLMASQPTPNLTFKNCTSAPFNFGIWWLGDVHPFNGKLDDLRIYNRALSENEIKYLFSRLP